jgi:hypothetical protein
MENGAIQIKRFPESHQSPCEEAVIASSGHVLYQLQSSVRLGHIGSVLILRRQRVTLTLTLDPMLMKIYPCQERSKRVGSTLPRPGLLRGMLRAGATMSKLGKSQTHLNAQPLCTSL